jgi:hypothetical protein
MNFPRYITENFNNVRIFCDIFHHTEHLLMSTVDLREVSACHIIEGLHIQSIDETISSIRGSKRTKNVIEL